MSSFAKGAVLFDGAGGNFQVHTSRRVAPGKPKFTQEKRM